MIPLSLCYFTDFYFYFTHFLVGPFPVKAVQQVIKHDVLPTSRAEFFVHGIYKRRLVDPKLVNYFRVTIHYSVIVIL